jgi:hypothetical protein
MTTAPLIYSVDLAPSLRRPFGSLETTFPDVACGIHSIIPLPWSGEDTSGKPGGPATGDEAQSVVGAEKITFPSVNRFPPCIQSAICFCCIQPLACLLCSFGPVFSRQFLHPSSIISCQHRRVRHRFAVLRIHCAYPLINGARSLFISLYKSSIVRKCPFENCPFMES